MVWSLPLGGAAGSARRFSFHFHLFLSASWPRSEVSGSPLRDIFVVFCRSPTLGSFSSLGWSRVLNLWRTGPRLPSRPPFPLMAGVGPVPAAACAVPCCEMIAAGLRACACVRGADA